MCKLCKHAELTFYNFGGQTSNLLTIMKAAFFALVVCWSLPLKCNNYNLQFHINSGQKTGYLTWNKWISGIQNHRNAPNRPTTFRNSILSFFVVLYRSGFHLFFYFFTKHDFSHLQNQKKEGNSLKSCYRFKAKADQVTVSSVTD